MIGCELMNKITKMAFFVILGIMLFGMFTNVAYASDPTEPETRSESRKNSWFVSTDPVSCGSVTNIPRRVPEFFGALINVVQVIVPIFLVIFGVLDLIKGMMSQKEDEIKKGQQTLMKRVIMGMFIFLIILLTKILVSALAEGSNNKNNIIDCIDCFVSGSCL